MNLLKSATALEIAQRQRQRDERLAWLHSLRPGDAVTLTHDGAKILRVVERAIVVDAGNGTESGVPWLAVETWPRRNLRGYSANPGTWRRNGRDWEEMRIDPLGETKP